MEQELLMVVYAFESLKAYLWVQESSCTPTMQYFDILSIKKNARLNLLGRYYLSKNLIFRLTIERVEKIKW